MKKYVISLDEGTTSARASRIAVTTFGSAPRSTSLMVLTGTPLFTASSG